MLGMIAKVSEYDFYRVCFKFFAPSEALVRTQRWDTNFVYSYLHIIIRGCLGGAEMHYDALRKRGGGNATSQEHQN